VAHPLMASTAKAEVITMMFFILWGSLNSFLLYQNK